MTSFPYARFARHVFLACCAMSPVLFGLALYFRQVARRMRRDASYEPWFRWVWGHAQFWGFDDYSDFLAFQAKLSLMGAVLHALGALAVGGLLLSSTR